jgi:hypothetical protein
MEGFFISFSFIIFVLWKIEAHTTEISQNGLRK